MTSPVVYLLFGYIIMFAWLAIMITAIFALVKSRCFVVVFQIIEVWENEGWSMPVVEENYNPDRTRLSLEFAKKQTIKTSDKKQTTKTEIHREKIRVVG